MVNRNGFTLIELLVVMALISMLLSLSAPRYFGHVDKAKETVLRQNLAQLRDAIDKYFSDNGCYPDTLDELVERHYLRRVPVDPLTERADTWVIVPPQRERIGNLFDVHSGAAGKGSDGNDYASW
ncbi:type II secretion system protein [Massilia sp. YMA4]|uniref:type II secretion system protein n=1 Tax=Massilia sp. YMA4 TaxID=1593482 RepID=UPI000DD10B69|nr:prepilin-type N-terminal cleavage/methylation domain-containing protein [Massilia sp. YMA4]AXA91102.1 type II secretion system protein G [Massilia sp. YMA4]